MIAQRFFQHHAIHRLNHTRFPGLHLLITILAIGCFPAHASGQGSPDVVWSSEYSTGGPTSVAFAPNGQTVISGETDKASQIWFAANGGPASRLLQGQIGCGTVNDVAYAPDGQLVATLNGCTLKLWSVTTGTLIRTINSGGGANASNAHTSVAFSPDGQIVAASVSTAYGSGSVKLWRVSDGVLLRTLTGGGGTDLAFSPDGQIVASIGLSKVAGLAMWRVSDGSLIRSITGVIKALSFSADGELIATTGLTGGEFDGDDTIEIYAVSDGMLERRIKRTGGVGALAFTPDDQALFSAGYDPNQDSVHGYIAETGVVRVWRLSDGALLKTYDQSTGNNVVDLAVSADGKYFAYGFGKTTVMARVPDYSTAACAFSIDPVTAVQSCSGASGTIRVSAPAGCAWHAASRVSWITITSGSSGVGNGVVNYTVAPNGCNAIAGSDLTQDGQVVVAEQPFIVRQRLAVSADPTPTPTPTETPTATPTPTPTPTETPDDAPTLLTEENSDKAIALDSVTWIRDPLSITTPNNYFAADGHTRVMLFATKVQNADAPSLVLEAEDAEHHTYPLLVEYVGKVSQFDWLSEVVVRLPDELANQEQVWITIKARGVTSNKVSIRLRR